MTGAPGQTCSTGSHLPVTTRSFIAVACRQISVSSAVLPMPAGPEMSITPLDPCWRVLRSSGSARAISSARPRNGPGGNVTTSVTDGPALLTVNPRRGARITCGT
jgi:hypothetical protein